MEGRVRSYFSRVGYPDACEAWVNVIQVLPEPMLETGNQDQLLSAERAGGRTQGGDGGPGGSQPRRLDAGTAGMGVGRTMIDVDKRSHARAATFCSV